ncbi:pollen receptor-like kinase 1 [Olea europaea subsp. europaea]|uniref:non-specific serine/threonine protein kinase n=1 Tax=Olea europaea subsp. europaea TaxID=158383 RepID=A0A8S0TPS1_OLEEU|nr:pollen receptor-like kinase 1 [Olea europaea subsp. europaea]
MMAQHRHATILWGHSRLMVLLFIIILHFVMCSCKSDAEILLKFKESLKDNGALSNWNDTKPPCSGYNENWVGIICGNGTVSGVKLENMGLAGVIDVDALKELKILRTISLMNNKFDGSLPNITELGALKSIYLSDNQFSGAIPIGIFDGMLSLKKVHLARNKFSGEIPQSLITLPRLRELMLQDNEFEGEIPQFRNGMLKSFNVSDNELTGEIPRGLSHMNATSFSGNEGLCGAPLESCSPAKLSVGTIIIVMILVALAIAALTSVVVILYRRKQMLEQEQATVSPPGHRKAYSTDLDIMEQGGASPEHRTNGKKRDNNTKLTFLQDDREKFDMGYLLKASAEILGSGIFGSTYKASLSGGQAMAVKRFRHMNNVGKEEFHEHMRRLGRMSHQNVLPIVAFYYRKEEKLLVSEYMENISLAVHLHGNTSRGLPCPDWPTRLNIIKGVAKGLLYLNNELPSLMAPHGHLKSSNILLDRSFNPLLTDYGLVPVMNQDRAQEHMIAYKSPEYKNNGRITKKTDVWSLGMLILETMTGIFPSSFLQQGSKRNDMDLVSWVESVVKEANADVDQVFDKNMGGKQKSEREMMKLLQIGLNCCEAEVDKRWDLKQAAERIEQVKQKDNDNDQEYNSIRLSN